GHYISVDTSYEGEKAVLSSPELYSEEWSCVRLIYQITTTSEASPDPARLNLYLRQEGESFDRLLWSAKEPSDSWLIASLDLMNSTKKYKIVLEGEMGQDKSASIAVFEIKITPGYCIGKYCLLSSHILCIEKKAQINGKERIQQECNVRELHIISSIASKGSSSLFHLARGDPSGFFHSSPSLAPIPRQDITGIACAEQDLALEAFVLISLFCPWGCLVIQACSQSFPVTQSFVIFEVAFNSAKGGYVALDDISFSPVYCSNQTGMTPFNPAEAGCNFEEDLCNFYQDHKDGPGWSRVKVKRNVYRAGDHTTGFGYYLLANTKFTSQPGYIGRLYGPTLPGNLQFCLRFYYALYGFFKMSGTLAVYIFEENHVVQEKIWSVLDSPKGVWTQAEISFKKPMPCKVVFVSWCKSFWDCGLVALDDVSLSLGSCQAADLLLPNPGECTFEKDECMFTQKKRGRGSWHRRRGPTPTSYTGPKGDHTTGVG
ncbi:MAMC2 protein, partial [Phaetusa simplex]|nr:MAMC2 protein [Phaetusa simplex]